MADEAVLEHNPFPVEDYEQPGMGFSSLTPIQLNFGRGEDVPGYWSRQRDTWLLSFSRRSDPVKVALKTFISKAATIPLRITPRDASVTRFNRQAVLFETALMRNSGFLRGFRHEFQKFMMDYLTQDNGAFMLILGGGNLAGPIVGAASGLYHLESSRCNRTRNPEYPVVYYHNDGKRYKIHYTRILTMVSMPSPELDLNGIGQCAVSLCLDAATELRSITNYALEKMGSRPARQIVYAKTGSTIEQLNGAVRHWETKLDNEQLSMFAKTLLMAPLMPGGKLELDMLDLASTPDGFERQPVTLLDMALIAAAFGLDLRDLAHSFGISGQTKSDAEVQDRKGRGKGVGELVETFAQLLTERFLPEHLVASFDNLDDSQDEQVARIRSERAMARSRDMAGKIVTARGARLQMLREHELTEAELEEMELADGRLLSGASVLSLFHRDELPYTRLLKIEGMEDPTNLYENDPEKTLIALHNATVKSWEAHEKTTDYETRRSIRRAIAALDWLTQQYIPLKAEQEAKEQAEEQAEHAQEQVQMQQKNPPTGKAPFGGLQGAKNAGIKPAGGDQPKRGRGEMAAAPIGRKAVPIASGGDSTKSDDDTEDSRGDSEKEINPLKPVPNFEPAVYSGADTMGLDSAITRFEKRYYPKWWGILTLAEGYSYDPLRRQYRDDGTGEYIDFDVIVELAQGYSDSLVNDAYSLAEGLETDLELDRWMDDAVTLVDDAFIAAYLLGVGGLTMLDDNRKSQLGGTLAAQYDYLNGFAGAIALGTMSRAQVGARLALYMRAAMSNLWRGRASAYDLILPAYPGDGSTECVVNCHCAWRIVDEGDSWAAYWELGVTEHCATCQERATVWYPYRVNK